MHGNAPERTLYICEWAGVTLRRQTSVSAEFLSFMSLHFKNWDL